MAKRGRLFIVLSVGVAILVFGLVLLQSIAGAQERVSPPISLGRVELDESFVTAGGFTVDAFVPTGSSSDRCLAMLTESNFAVPGTTLFCNVREVNGTPGVRINIFLPSPAPADLVYAVTVYQEFAQGYGTPVPCSQVVGCG